MITIQCLEFRVELKLYKEYVKISLFESTIPYINNSSKVNDNHDFISYAMFDLLVLP